MTVIQSILKGDTETTPEDIEQLTGMITDLYRNEPNIVEIPNGNIVFIGDLHGELDSILSVQNLFSKYKNHTFVFLGDYVDRGPAQIKTFNLAMALAISNPKRVLLLRGNHESDEVARRYGFYTEVTRKFSIEVYSNYLKVFQVLPMGAIIPNLIFACHGGIPETVESINDLQKCNRFYPDFEDDTLLQLAWNDPKDADFRFAANSRGARVKAFGRVAFNEFAKNLDIQIMFRAHEVFPEGFKRFFDGRLFSVFSASYHGAAMPKVLRLDGGLDVEPLGL
ncbi:MAG: metallophosphoesterase [Candidatus Thorarchaeota archaeon]